MNLTSWLQKKGIHREEDATPEEQITIARYKRILSGTDLVTVESLKEFCKSQLAVIESACDGKTSLTAIQQAGLHIYLTLIKAIEAPEAEREALERKLQEELQ